MKKWLKVLLIVLGSILIFLTILTVCIGPIAKVVIEKHSKEICHRTVTMDKLRINLFTGSVGIYGFNALEEDDSTSFVRFNTLKVNINVLALITKTVKLRYIQLDAPVIRVTQRGSTFNFSDIIEFYRPDEPDTTPSTWVVDLNNIALNQGDFEYADLLMNSQLHMRDVNIEVPRLCFGRGRSDANLSLLFDKGGKLDVKLAYGMEKSDYMVYLNLDNFNLSPVIPYLRNYLTFKNINGILSANVVVSGNLNHILQMSAKGNVSLRNLDVDGKYHEDIVKMDRLSVDVDTLNIEKRQFYFEKIEFDGLQAKFEINKHGNSFATLFAEDTEAEKKGKAEDVPEVDVTEDGVDLKTIQPQYPDIKINHFVMNNCGMSFEDKTIKNGTMSLPVSNIHVDAHNLSSNALSEANLYAHFGKTGEFLCSWKGFLSALGSQTMSVEIKDLQMKELSPYCVHYFAYPISKGVLVYKGTATLIRQDLNNQNHIDLYNLTIDKKLKNVKPEYKLPLQAAAYVLTDMTGRAQLDLPVTGNINNPKFSVTKIIVKAFFNTILRVVASPVDLIIQACRANADAFKDLSVDLDQQSITSKQYDQFNAICEVMKAKPELIVTIQPSFNAENYGSTGTPENNELTMRQYENIKALVYEHFGKYGITADRLRFMDEFGKKVCLKDKTILSFNVIVPGMDDEDGMQAVAESEEENE